MEKQTSLSVRSFYSSLDSVDNPNKSGVCALILPLGIDPLSLEEPNYLLSQQRKGFIRTSHSQPTPLPDNDLPDDLLPLRPFILPHLLHTCSLFGSCLQVSYFDFKDFESSKSSLLVTILNRAFVVRRPDRLRLLPARVQEICALLALVKVPV